MTNLKNCLKQIFLCVIEFLVLFYLLACASLFVIFLTGAQPSLSIEQLLLSSGLVSLFIYALVHTHSHFARKSR